MLSFPLSGIIYTISEWSSLHGKFSLSSSHWPKNWTSSFCFEWSHPWCSTLSKTGLGSPCTISKGFLISIGPSVDFFCLSFIVFPPSLISSQIHFQSLSFVPLSSQHAILAASHDSCSSSWQWYITDTHQCLPFDFIGSEFAQWPQSKLSTWF